MYPPLLERIGAALDAGAAISTEALAALLIETGGEKCWRRPRILHLLTFYLKANGPQPMSQSTTHRFKADFAHADFSGFPLVVGNDTKIVTARNLTDDDVPLLKQYGGGHLIEPLPKAEATTKKVAAELSEVASIAAQTIADVDAAEAKAPKKKH